MANPYLTTRRGVLGCLGAGIVSPFLSLDAVAQGRPKLTLQAKAGLASLRPGQPDTPVWLLQAAPDAPMHFKRGDEAELTLINDLPVPVSLNWHGVDGAAGIEPLTARAPLAPGGKDTLVMPLRHAGTMLCDIRLLGDISSRPLPARAFVVHESEAVAVDRDEVLLIEDWRLRPDGTAVAPGSDIKDTITLYSANGAGLRDIAVRTNERLRLRIINGCQRSVVAIKIENHDVWVMALDSQPAEPFLARDGQLVLAPGTRIDAFIDAGRSPASISQILLHDGRDIRPIARLVYSGEAPIRATPLLAASALPSNGLPSQLDLKNAVRIGLALNASGDASDWTAPANFAAARTPAFQTKRGRTVVLALTNRSDSRIAFHLHGHHFRLLDRLDDGWKPFWLDTLAVEGGQTQRVAFAAEHVGRWLMEAMATDWAAPRLVRWFAVE